MLDKILLTALGCAALTLPSAACGAAARVEFVSGIAKAVDIKGAERVLARGAEVGEGDTVDTGNARVQLRFSDGAYVSLQPQSKFRIDEYRFDGRTDGSERGFFSLLQGGLRTITGLVGRTNKKNYQVSTGIATIGIRGTEYTVSYGSSLSGSVGEGEIAVCNAGGCANITSGESYYVSTADVKPVITGKKTDLPPPPPEPPPAKLVAGDATTATGMPAGLMLSGVLSLPLAHAVSINCASVCSAYGVIPSDVIAFNADGTVASVNSGKDPLGGVTGFGNNGVIAWGRGLDKFGQYFHYATGLPTAGAELAQIAISTPVGFYSVIGATTPTAGAGAAQVVGQFQGATLTARFSTGEVDAAVRFAIAGSTIEATQAGMTISRTGNMTFTSAGANGPATCTGGCSPSGVQMAGFFAGPGATHAGLAYQIKYVQDASGVALAGPVSGTVAFVQGSGDGATGAGATRLPVQ
jgi:hypothetical protein